MFETVRLKGRIFSGVMRGAPLIDVYFPRLVGILGFEPFRGTLNVKLEKPIEIELYSTRSIEHLLLNGKKHIDAYLAPVTLTANGRDCDCWAMRHAGIIYTGPKDVIEIIAKEGLKQKFSLKDDEVVEITFFEQKRKKKDFPGRFIFERLYGKEAQLMKS